MARRRVGDCTGANLLVAIAFLVCAACKSVPAPVALPAVPEAAPVRRDTKLGWVFRLEQQRALRDAGVSAVALSAAPRADAFKPASAASLDAMAIDPDPVVRRRALLAIGRVGDAEGVPALVAALQDPDEDARAAAAFALGLLGADAKTAVEPLEAALNDPSGRVRARAIEGLGLIGDAAAVPAIFRTSGGCAARIATIEPDDEQTPKAPEIEICRLSLFAFVRLQNYDAIAATALNAQGQPVSRWWPVAYALQRINDRRAVPALLTLASTPGVNTAGFALRGLAGFKEASVVPVAKALAANRTADVKVRIAAVRALGQVGGAGGALPLAELLATPMLPTSLAVEIVTAIGATGYRPAFDTLVDWVTDASPVMRAAALTSAANVAPDAFLLVLAGLGRDADWSVRAALARILKPLPPERVTSALKDLAGDDDVRVRTTALESLAAVKVPDLTTRLFAALEAPDFVERMTAARLIGESQPTGGVPRLIAAYERGQSDQSYGARAATLEALAKYGGDDVKVVLRRGLGDREWPVRSRTAKLLNDLGDASATPERPARLRQPAEYFDSPALLHPSFSPHAFIETHLGVIEVELDVVNAAVTSQNFIDLARAGFFNSMPVHRVVPTFVFQVGDPRGDGEGGPGYAIPDELNPQPYVRGTMGMALDWRDTGGSQWFITLSPQPHLDAKYTAFGRVVNGWDVLDRVSQWDVIDRVRIWDGADFK